MKTLTSPRCIVLLNGVPIDVGEAGAPLVPVYVSHGDEIVIHVPPPETMCLQRSGSDTETYDDDDDM